MSYRNLLAAAALICAQPLSAQSFFHPRQLEPTSDWVLDYGDEYCGLVRRFGDGDDELILQIADWGTFGYYEVTLRGPSVPLTSGPVEQIRFRFNPSQEMTTESAMMGTADGAAYASFTVVFVPPAAREHLVPAQRGAQVGPVPLDATFERAATNWQVDLRDMEYSLSTGSMVAPLNALRECRKDLFESWGLDGETQMTLSLLPKPVNLPLNGINQSYPREAARVGRRAFVPIRVVVGEDGKAESCTAQADQGNTEFIEAACKNLLTAYLPGRDAVGNPTRSVYQTRLFFLK